MLQEKIEGSYLALCPSFYEQVFWSIAVCFVSFMHAEMWTLFNSNNCTLFLSFSILVFSHFLFIYVCVYICVCMHACVIEHSHECMPLCACVRAHALLYVHECMFKFTLYVHTFCEVYMYNTSDFISLQSLLLKKYFKEKKIPWSNEQSGAIKGGWYRQLGKVTVYNLIFHCLLLPINDDVI